MQVDLLVVLLAVLAVANYRSSRSVLYPPFIFSIMWFLVFLVYQTHLIEVDPLHGETLLLVGAGAFLFSLGGVLARLMPNRLISTRIRIGRAVRYPGRNHLLKYLLLAACLIGMLFIVRGTIASGAGGAGGSVLERARTAGVQASNEGRSAFSVLAYVPLWATCTSIMF